jgi:spore coat protein U-like protein
MALATDSTKTLSYSLSAVAPGGANWGAVGEAGVASGTGNGAGQPIVVYGRIPAGQTSAVTGTYSDLVIATIDF